MQLVRCADEAMDKEPVQVLSDVWSKIRGKGMNAKERNAYDRLLDKLAELLEEREEGTGDFNAGYATAMDDALYYIRYYMEG